MRSSAARIPALEQAVGLYRGDFLDGFYDDWVLSERYRLESLYHDALAQLTAAREAMGVIGEAGVVGGPGRGERFRGRACRMKMFPPAGRSLSIAHSMSIGRP